MEKKKKKKKKKVGVIINNNNGKKKVLISTIKLLKFQSFEVIKNKIKFYYNYIFILLS